MQKASPSWQDATEVRWRERSGRRTSSGLLKTPKGDKRLMRLVYDLTANDIGSVAGRFAFAGGAVYCGTKFAVGAHHGRAAARGPGLRRARDGH
jgi:hypothetical protein